jgi:RNA polymerase subunit RPABC4/transcription elongation factor Spt4
MKKKECPSCAMEIDEDSEQCPICDYEFSEPVSRRWVKWVAIFLLLIIFLYWIL